jgi:hypothetical protein
LYNEKFKTVLVWASKLVYRRLLAKLRNAKCGLQRVRYKPPDTDGRARTGTPLREADFLTTIAFATRKYELSVRGLDDAFSMPQ